MKEQERMTRNQTKEVWKRKTDEDVSKSEGAGWNREIGLD